MKIVLLKNIEKLGKEGEIVNVKDGYARNFLIPKGYALLANEKNIIRAEIQFQEKKRKIEKEKRRKQEIINSLNGKSFTILVEADGDGKLFGSIREQDICEHIFQQTGQKLDEKILFLEEPIKQVGVYEVGLKFENVTGKIRVWVVSKDEKKG